MTSKTVERICVYTMHSGGCMCVCVSVCMCGEHSFWHIVGTQQMLGAALNPDLNTLLCQLGFLVAQMGIRCLVC